MLNQIIFNDIVYHLINNEKSFDKILNISLISKSTFKLIQHIIINQTQYDRGGAREIKPIYFNLYGYFNFILRSLEINNDQSYSKKLIQYKSIKVLYTKIKYWMDVDDGYIDIKNAICQLCPSLERVVLLRGYYSYWKPLPFEHNEQTGNGFFKYNKISISYDDVNGFPYSTEEECNYGIGYSFRFLTMFHPRKLSFSNKSSSSQTLISNFRGIFKNGGKSLESIEFKINHITPFRFLTQSLNSIYQNIKSLKVRYNNSSIKEIQDEDYESDSSDESDQKESNKQPIVQLGGINDLSEYIELSIKYSNVSNNNTLRKLIIRKCIEGSIITTNDRPSLLINQLLGNTSLSTLGLEFYDIKTSLELSQLTLLPNITTLYCNISSIDSIFEHCNQNPNIKKLIIGNEENIEYNQTIKESFINFFQSKYTLQSLIIVNNKSNHYNNKTITNNIINELYIKSNIIAFK